MHSSPLRYPGGKALMTQFFAELFRVNNFLNVRYAEPYAGGAGAAINLLLEDAVDEIIINDANIGIYSFWDALIKDSEHFIQKIQDIPVTLEEWYRQKEIFKSSDKPSFELGIATFFLSRTNRSGIITGGAIGGITEEKQKEATYKIDCRFNKDNLIPKLEAIAKQRKRITVSNNDALAFLRNLANDVFVYLDPPYYIKGKSLYMNHYTENDHRQLARYLQNDADFTWILSYDDVPQIRELYSDFNLYRFSLKYTVETKRTGYELLTHSRNIYFPENIEIRRSRRDNINLTRIV